MMDTHITHVQSGEGDLRGMKDLFGPGAVDAAIRQAISLCWMVLPENKRTVAHVQDEIHRLVDRALKNLSEDAEAFGIALPPPK